MENEYQSGAGLLSAVDPLLPPPEGRNLSVLTAEDNPIYQSMLRAMLVRWGYDPIIARDGSEAWRALDVRDPPRLAILDWMMPGMDGVEICRRVRAAGREPYTYILLLTARAESQDLVDGMDAGADDYLTKPFIAQELRVRLRAGRRILELQTELVGAREELRVQATHDTLTGISNRKAIFDALLCELSRASRDRQPVAVLMVDIDRFKQVNDTHGHQIGDAVLREAAHRMKSAMRQYDAIGRYGGEEFLVVMPGCNGENIFQQAERLRGVIRAEPFRSHGRALDITCSVGGAWRDLASPNDNEALIREADLALYQAKGNGRNRVETYVPNLTDAQFSLPRIKLTNRGVT